MKSLDDLDDGLHFVVALNLGVDHLNDQLLEALFLVKGFRRDAPVPVHYFPELLPDRGPGIAGHEKLVVTALALQRLHLHLQRLRQLFREVRSHREMQRFAPLYHFPHGQALQVHIDPDGENDELSVRHQFHSGPAHDLEAAQRLHQEFLFARVLRQKSEKSPDVNPPSLDFEQHGPLLLQSAVLYRNFLVGGGRHEPKFHTAKEPLPRVVPELFGEKNAAQAPVQCSIRWDFSRPRQLRNAAANDGDGGFVHISTQIRHDILWKSAQNCVIKHIHRASVYSKRDRLRFHEI
mmetsp:Transcript_28139/g.74279  ORF Transcript_28139/g.74279 Transcript_28139/m.74279 type:complete len:292 (+) Transcript_28139:714-1589(+)